MGFQEVDLALQTNGLGRSDKNVLMALCKFANNETHDTFVTNAKAMQIAEVSETAFYRAIENLIRKGLIEKRGSRATRDKRLWVNVKGIRTWIPSEKRALSDSHGGSLTPMVGVSDSHGGSVDSHGGSVDSHGGSVDSHGGSVDSHGGSVDSHGGSSPIRESILQSKEESILQSSARDDRNANACSQKTNQSSSLSWEFALKTGRRVEDATDAVIEKVWRRFEASADADGNWLRSGRVLRNPRDEFISAVHREAAKAVASREPMWPEPEQSAPVARRKSSMDEFWAEAEKGLATR